MRHLLTSIAFGLAATPAWACELGLPAKAQQGGLVVGTAPKGTAVTVDGRKVRVSAEGRFLVGFSRDATKPADVVATLADGRALKCAVGVEKRQYNIQRIDGLPKRQVSPSAEDLKRIRTEQQAIDKARWLNSAGADFLAGFQWPLKGRISGVYGSQRVLNGQPRRPHLGVDIAAPTGTPILAPAPGTVAMVHADMFFTGKSVILDHGHGLTSFYVHMSAISVKEGQRLERDQEIGKVGQTGRATGPHLHWGVALFSTHLDPALLAGKMPETKGKAQP
ncbi:MAG: M23 family metallopeptidase [Rhodospirillaceae bacterium]